MSYTFALFLLFSFLLFILGLLYKQYHIRKIFHPKEEQIPQLNSVNGIGALVMGGYKIKDTEYRIYYIMLSIAFLPFLPLGAIIAKKKDTSSKIVIVETKYEILCSVKMNFFEVLACYALYWGGALFFLLFIVFLLIKFNIM